jgi:hypothetical protein
VADPAHIALIVLAAFRAATVMDGFSADLGVSEGLAPRTTAVAAFPGALLRSGWPRASRLPEFLPGR